MTTDPYGRMHGECNQADPPVEVVPPPRPARQTEGGLNWSVPASPAWLAARLADRLAGSFRHDGPLGWRCDTSRLTADDMLRAACSILAELHDEHLAYVLANDVAIRRDHASEHQYWLATGDPRSALAVLYWLATLTIDDIERALRLARADKRISGSD